VGHKEVPVTHLRKVTREEIARRNYTKGTTCALGATASPLDALSLAAK
jgi:hypothetical protein